MHGYFQNTIVEKPPLLKRNRRVSRAAIAKSGRLGVTFGHAWEGDGAMDMLDLIPN